MPRGAFGVVTSDAQKRDQRYAASAATAQAEFPDRPDARILNKSIPLFFITKNNNGFWVVREAGGKVGGIFLFKRSALRFATRNSTPLGCARMFLTEHFELDVRNQGNRLIAALDAFMRRMARLRPKSIAVSGNGSRRQEDHGSPAIDVRATSLSLVESQTPRDRTTY